MLKAWLNSLELAIHNEFRKNIIARELFRLMLSFDWSKCSMYDLWFFVQRFSKKYVGSDFLVKLINIESLRELGRASSIIKDIVSKLRGYERFKASVKAALVSTNFSIQSIYINSGKYPYTLTVGEVLSEYANIKLRANILRQLYRDIDGMRILYLSGSVLEIMFDRFLVDEVSKHCRRLIIVPSLPLTKELNRKVMDEVPWIEKEIRTMSKKGYMVFNVESLKAVDDMIFDSDLIIVKNPLYYIYARNNHMIKVFYIMAKSACKVLINEFNLPVDNYILMRIGAKRYVRTEGVATEAYAVISHVLPVHRIAQLLES